jgi:hypothetical protein
VTARPVSPARTARRAAAVAGLLAPALALVASCTSAAPPSSGLPPIGAGPVAPPPPPAACLLDTDALTAGTGLSWTPDATTASDTRCVYDPGPGPTPSAAPSAAAPATGSGAFVAVGIAEATAQPPDAQLDVLAQPCSAGSRKPTRTGGFVCRFPAGSVFAGRVRAEQVITIAASAVPAGTTADALAGALGQQLDALR